MYKFYIDESGLGKNAEERVCSVAGLLASNSAWRTFEHDFAILLKSFGVSEFHAKAFWSRRSNGHLAGAYQDWTFDRANHFIRDIVALICSARPWLCGASIKLEDFFSYSVEQRRFLTGAIYDGKRREFRSSGKASAAYFVPFQVLIIKAAELGRDLNQDCHFIFDEQNEFSPLAKIRIAQMKTLDTHGHLLPFWGDTAYASSRRVLPLQCADLVAFCCRNYYKKQMYSLSFNLDKSRSVVSSEVTFRTMLEKLRPRTRLIKLEKPELDMLLAHSNITL